MGLLPLRWANHSDFFNTHGCLQVVAIVDAFGTILPFLRQCFMSALLLP